MLRFDGCAPSLAIFFIDKLRHRHLAEIRIAKKLGAVVERSPIGLGNQVNGTGGGAGGSKIVSFKNVERFHKRSASGRRGRGAYDFESAIGASHRRAVFDFIAGEVVSRDKPA